MPTPMSLGLAGVPGPGDSTTAWYSPRSRSLRSSGQPTSSFLMTLGGAAWRRGGRMCRLGSGGVLGEVDACP